MENGLKEKVSSIIKNNLLYSFVFVYVISVVSVILMITIQESDKDENTILTDQENIAEDTKFISAEIAGAVKKPGVYKLDKDSRLVDLVRECGGFTQDSSEEWLSKYLNLSSQVTDQQKVYIPFKWDYPVKEIEQNKKISRLTNTYTQTHYLGSGTEPDQQQTSGKSLDGTININTASREDIDDLPGIGPVYAGKLIENRPYDNFQALVDASGVPKGVLEKIKDKIQF